jgi:hypothetical protein
VTTTAHDFDFIFGHWTIRNRKLVDVADPTCEEWEEFEAISEAYPILDGLGHIDRMYVSEPVSGPAFEGFTLRLFEPASATWSIWWSSSKAPGVLDPPVRGRFASQRGVFDCEDIVGSRAVKIRFEWLVEDPDAPQWRQSFSYDSGISWHLNWTMRLTRTFLPKASQGARF